MPSSKARPPFHRDGWVIEEKIDGWRIVAYIEPLRRARLGDRRAPRPRGLRGEGPHVQLPLRADAVMREG